MNYQKFENSPQKTKRRLSCLIASFFIPANLACSAADEANTQLTLADLKIFNSSDSSVAPEKLSFIATRIKEETGLEKARDLPSRDKRAIVKAFKNGRAGQYTVQQLLDAGLFTFRPIINLHPKSTTSDDDKSVRPRDGKDLEIDNSVWGKKNIPAAIKFGVLHSTEDGAAGAARTIDMWNEDAAAGKRSSSTPFVVGRCIHSPEIYVTADFETRWQRHCSSKLTSRPGVVNWSSVGVEMEHSSEKHINYTSAEMKAVARLWTYIQERAAIPDNCLITHGELQGHLPKDHLSFRSDPEGFNWKKFGNEMLRLRKKGIFSPPPADESLPKTIPQQAIEEVSQK